MLAHGGPLGWGETALYSSYSKARFAGCLHPLPSAQKGAGGSGAPDPGAAGCHPAHSRLQSEAGVRLRSTVF